MLLGSLHLMISLHHLSITGKPKGAPLILYPLPLGHADPMEVDEDAIRVNSTPRLADGSAGSSPQPTSQLDWVKKREELSIKKENFTENTLWKAQAVKSFFQHYYDELFTFLAEREERRLNLMEKLKERRLTDADKKLKLASHYKIESEFLRERRRRLSQRSFETIRLIGRGGFGEVRLVRMQGTQLYYAMKRISKEHIVQKDQVKHIKAERALMIDNNAFYNAENPWVVTLYSCFQDHNYLFLVMEYMPGGDLMTQLIRKDIFTEDEARFYLAELALALDSIHRMGYIHRDIKPDNILIGKDGHIKLGDFGLCTGIRFAQLSAAYQTMRRASGGTSSAPMAPSSSIGRRGSSGTPIQLTGSTGSASKEMRANVPKSAKNQLLAAGANKSFKSWARKKRVLADSHVGTLDYIAPEILFDQVPYGKEVDWWSAGCILFEMVCGHAPFMSGNQDKQAQFREVCENIGNHKEHVAELLSQHPKLSSECKDLITKLLTVKEERLGRDSVEEVKVHPFFHGIDWESMQDIDEMQPPFVPNIKDPTDTQCFDPIDPEPELPASPKDPHREFFVGFTYRNFKAYKQQRGPEIKKKLAASPRDASPQPSSATSRSSGSGLVLSPSAVAAANSRGSSPGNTGSVVTFGK